MNHAERARVRLAGSRPARLAALWLACIAFVALFAELFASEAPIVAIGPRGASAFAAVTSAAEYATLSRDAVLARHARDFAVWPVWKSGPQRRSEVGPDAPPSVVHPLGTDTHGRDVLAIVVHGARGVTGPLLVGLFFATALGVALGTVAGTRGGVFEALVLRCAELCAAVPTVLVAAVVAALAPHRTGTALVVAIALVRWAEVARVVRYESIRLATSNVGMAARALGCTELQIARRHLLPRVLPALVVETAGALPALVWTEAAVSFLGIDVSASWGSLIADAFTRGGSTSGAACAVVLVILTASAATLLAESVRDALSPKR